MPDWSRRRALHAIGSVATVAVAGCSGSGSGFEEPSVGRRGDRVSDYELREARDGDGQPLFWRSDDGESQREDDRRLAGHEYVSSREDAEALTFASDSDAATELSSFLRETDFESSSVLLEAREVAECNELVFRGVWRTSDQLQTAYCTRLRPADVACGVEAKDTAGVAIRLPFADADFSGFSSSRSSRCDARPVDVDGRDGGGGS